MLKAHLAECNLLSFRRQHGQDVIGKLDLLFLSISIWGGLAITGLGGLHSKLQLRNGIKALAQVGLYGQWVPGLCQDLQQLIVRQEVEPGNGDTL